MMKHSHKNERQNRRETAGVSLPACFAILFALIVAPSIAMAGSWTAQPTWSPPTETTSHYPHPAVADLNRDGLPDLLFGLANTNASNTGGALSAYKNTGTATAPVWTAELAGSSWITLGAPCNRVLNSGLTGDDGYYQPALGDLDGDGKVDLVLGTRNFVCIYKNTGTGNPGDPPVWTRADGTGAAGHTAVGQDWEAGLKSLDTNRFYNPALGDFDNDGHLDLRLTWSGGSTFFKNSGSGSPFSPLWTETPDWGPVGFGGSG